MKKAMIALFALVFVGTFVVTASAQPYTSRIENDVYGIIQCGGNDTNVPTPRDDNDNLSSPDAPDYTDINDAINSLVNPITPYAHNSDVDYLQYTGPDATWKDLSSDESEGTYVMIGFGCIRISLIIG